MALSGRSASPVPICLSPLWREKRQSANVSRRRNPPDHRDSNEPEIVAAFEAAGALAIPIRGKVAGTPDLLVGFRRTWFVVEVKTVEAKKRLSNDQKDFRDLCEYQGYPWYLATDQNDVEAILCSI